MAQSAYLWEGELDVRASCDAETALSVSLFGDSEGAMAVMAEDVATAGMQLRASRSLESLHETGGGVLGDIVLVDCPRVDAARLAALVRLDERAARSGAQLVVSTSVEALQDVFGCLDRSNPQILVAATRAERLVALGGALARVPGRRLRELDESDRQTLLRLTEEVGRLAQKLEALPAPIAGSGYGTSVIHVASPTMGFRHAEYQQGLERKARPPLPDPRLVKRVIAQRQLRAKFFDAELFADPAWDILLDLTAARAEHRRVSVSSLCIAANVPATTALRWISQMVESRLLVRVQDEADKRRAFIELADETADAMAHYFDALGTEVAHLA
ncbi:MAG: winged helix DNA-binding protein [Qipengyuania sp.]